MNNKLIIKAYSTDIKNQCCFILYSNKLFYNKLLELSKEARVGYIEFLDKENFKVLEFYDNAIDISKDIEAVGNYGQYKLNKLFRVALLKGEDVCIKVYKDEVIFIYKEENKVIYSSKFKINEFKI